jgi:adenylate cyclase
MMQESRRNPIFERIGSIGGEVTDPDLRTQKVATVAVCLFAVPVSITWTLFAFSLGEVANAYAIILGGSLLLLALLYYAWRGNYRRFRTSVYVIGLLWTLVLHFSVGGFSGSKSLTWGFLVPVVALLSSKPREGMPWFVAFMAIVIASGFVDPILFPEKLTLARSLSQFAFSMVTVSLIIYAVLVYFVRQKNRAYELLSVEQEKSDRLLLNVLPEEIALILKSGKETIADRYESVSVLFADIVGFTPLSTEMDAKEMVNLLNEVFSHFDTLVHKHGVEKLRTMGDNYMVVSGAPRRREDHAQAIASLALEMQAFIEDLPAHLGQELDFRIGINSGPLIAGVIGKQKFHYDVWGDVVNVASRMETYALPGMIQIAEGTFELIKDEFECEPRGTIEIKGKGRMETWFLESRRHNRN